MSDPTAVLKLPSSMTKEDVERVRAVIEEAIAAVRAEALAEATEGPTLYIAMRDRYLAKRDEADVLRAAIPEDPWVGGSRDSLPVCYACYSPVFRHVDSCAWLAARAAMQP